VDHAFFSPGDRRGARSALGVDPEGPLLLFVGRIQPLKGLDVAIDALRHLPADVRLVVVGGASGAEGADHERHCRGLVERFGLGDRVIFRPPQPHHLLSSYYRAADVCLVPSRSESFGLVALEALACGTPVVASSVGGIREYLTSALGLPVQENTAVAWAEAMDRDWDRLLALDASSLAAAIHPLVDSRRVAQRYMDVLRSAAFPSQGEQEGTTPPTPPVR